MFGYSQYTIIIGKWKMTDSNTVKLYDQKYYEMKGKGRIIPMTHLAPLDGYYEDYDLITEVKPDKEIIWNEIQKGISDGKILINQIDKQDKLITDGNEWYKNTKNDLLMEFKEYSKESKIYNSFDDFLNRTSK